MSEASWDLTGIDAGARERALAEAQQRGVDVSEFLTEVLLRKVISEARVDETPAAEPPPEPIVAEPNVNYALRHRLDAVERKLSQAVGGIDGAMQDLDKALFVMAERLDQTGARSSDAIQALQTLLEEAGVDIAALRQRLVNAEEETDALGEAHDALETEVAARYDTLDHRLAQTLVIARNAEAAAETLTSAHEALQQALAQDFNDHAEEISHRLGAAFDAMRTVADQSAQHADEALARGLETLRVTREAIEQNISDSAADTRARVQAAFADADSRIGALALRIEATEQTTRQAAVQLNARIANAEDAAQVALEQTAETLRQTQAELGREIAAVRDDQIAALEAARRVAAADVALVRERFTETEARLAGAEMNIADVAVEAVTRHDSLMQRVDAEAARVRALIADVEIAIARKFDDTGAQHNLLAEQVENTIERASVAGAELAARLEAVADNADTRLTHLEADLEHRTQGLSIRLEEHTKLAAHERRAAAAEIERVEACTLAALEKQVADRLNTEALLREEIERAAAELRNEVEGQTAARFDKEARDRVGGEAMLREEIERAAAFSRQSIEAVRQAQASESAEARTRHAATSTRLDRIDAMLGADGPVAAAADAVRDIYARLGAVETVIGDTSLANTVVNLQRQLIDHEARFAERQDEVLPARIEELSGRIVAHEAQSTEIANRLHGMARLISRVSAQGADVAAQTEERLHKIEIAMADVQLEQRMTPPVEDAVGPLAAQLDAFERRQIDALETLRAELANFAAESERRILALEQNSGAVPLNADEVLIAHAIEARLTELEQRDVTTAFDTLRQRVEDRILGLEGRSVRALEQVSETVALIERRMAEGEIADLSAKRSA